MQRYVSAVAAALLVMGSVTAQPAHTPYQVDAHTLHLWHLDEAAPPFKDSGSSPTLLLGLKNGATAGSPALPGMGSAIRFDASAGDDRPAERPYGPILLAKPEPVLGDDDNVSWPFPIMGSDGAFTIEAIVKLDVLPSASVGHAADIVTMDDDNPNNRVFLFRIEKPGFLCFVPFSGDAVRGGGLATIPTTGPHAINTKDWFHVAVTYDGNETVPHNLKLYWTRLTPETRTANQIGRGSLSADLVRQLGDFAIGNSGKMNPLGPFEFFPGYIDEVRISSVAREPHDYFFVDPEVGREMAGRAREQEAAEHGELSLQKIWVNGVETPHEDSPLSIAPGTHRLDFDFGFPSGTAADPLAVKCQLEGLDEEWKPISRGMSLTWEMLDAGGKTLASTVHWVTHSSNTWKSDAVDSPLEKRTEPLFIPDETRSVRVTMSSGTPDTTGSWVIDNLSLASSSSPDRNLWHNGEFDKGERPDQIGGVPSGWKRGGSEPAIARVMFNLTFNPALGIIDAEQDHSAWWTCTHPLDVLPAKGGEIFLLSWSEAFNVISGSSMRVSYPNVPPGNYKFRAIALAGHPAIHASKLELPFVVRQHFWERPWFPPLAIAATLLLSGIGLFLNYRRRARHRLATIHMANAVERDRARIARDMHDDLGTRVSLLKHAASVASDSLESEPDKARRATDRLEAAATDLVRAMDSLVWAVNPKNDTLEQLAAYLSGMAQEIFRDAPVRLRLEIPTDLPDLPLPSDFPPQRAQARRPLHCHAWARCARWFPHRHRRRQRKRIRSRGSRHGQWPAQLHFTGR
ncbi:MAG: hypothetical protein EOP88_13900 [Verrucomicrobiaceae bacterium]|nr:MAG: hypothetical protein EOP88_13900 [Verrucomicrobiaceae bacterium]